MNYLFYLINTIVNNIDHLIVKEFLLTARENAKSPKSNFIVIFVMSIWHLSRAFEGAMRWWDAACGRILDEREAGC